MVGPCMSTTCVPYYRPMPRVLVAASALLVIVLAGCAGAAFTFVVDDFVIPADSTVGTVCWAEVNNASGVAVSAATFEALATYRRGETLITTQSQAVVEVYGRDKAPTATCSSASGTDVKLGGPFTLTVDEAQVIRIGEGSAGAELARLANGGTYWLGARLTSGFQVGGEQSITFENSRIRVWL